MERSVEYGSGIIHSMETGVPRVVYANLENNNLITNLPSGCCVEVPCLVEKNGIQPTQIGALPPHLAALMQTNINVQALTVESILTGNREHIYHAAMLDPHTGAELDLDQIWQMVDDLITQHAEWIPHQFRNGQKANVPTPESEPAITAK
jgi:alpha-galactosidase